LLRMQLRVDIGRIVRVTGPLRVRVESGQILVLGAIFKAGEGFEVSEYRSYAIKALDDSVINVEMSEGAILENPRPDEEVLDKWVAEADDILRRGCRTIVVLGPTDAGKSSFTALLANRALLYGYHVGVVDADVGQADVGPPACVSAATVEKFVLWLRELRAKYIRFVGSITPQRAEERIIAGVVDLAAKLRHNDSVDVIVVDTDGWVQGVSSVEYKAEIARYIGADAVVVVGDDKLYGMVYRVFAGLPCGVRFVPSPRVRRERDRGERRELRREAYQRYLKPLVEREVDISRLSILGSCYFTGEPIRDARQLVLFAETLGVPVLAASETYDTVYIVTQGQPRQQGVQQLSEKLGKQVYILDVNLARNALVSIIGEDGEEKGIGILREIDFARGRARIATAYAGAIKGIVLGHIRLSEELEEVGRPLRCVI
jgi:polynucleotide 5'-hydroxyl-kinase GRC3/NOL9